MKEIELLELEIRLLQDNIKRVKKYRNAHLRDQYHPGNSHVVGELKHRCVALKQRLTIVSNLSTYKIFES